MLRDNRAGDLSSGGTDQGNFIAINGRHLVFILKVHIICLVFDHAVISSKLCLES